MENSLHVKTVYKSRLFPTLFVYESILPYTDDDFQARYSVTFIESLQNKTRLSEVIPSWVKLLPHKHHRYAYGVNNFNRFALCPGCFCAFRKAFQLYIAAIEITYLDLDLIGRHPCFPYTVKELLNLGFIQVPNNPSRFILEVKL